MLPEAFLLRLSRVTCPELDALIQAQPRLRHIDKFIQVPLPCAERVRAVQAAAAAADAAVSSDA